MSVAELTGPNKDDGFPDIYKAKSKAKSLSTGKDLPWPHARRLAWFETVLLTFSLRNWNVTNRGVSGVLQQLVTMDIDMALEALRKDTYRSRTPGVGSPAKKRRVGA